MNCETSYDLVREQSYPTPFQNSSLLPLLLMALAMQKHTPDTTRTIRWQYDYIVVGAGTAGSVVAGRLSEDPSKTVLLLEAGKSPPLLTDLPAAAPFLPGTDLFWNYVTEPQKFAALGQQNRSVPINSAKTVGGTSVINGMLYIRGNREDYNTWEELGAHGWDWCDVFSDFLKSEDNTDPDIAQNGFHAVGGLLTVGRFPYVSEYKYPLRNSALDMGYEYLDVNGRRQSGLADFQGTVRRGQRVSTAKAYLVPNDGKPNLDIVAEAYVTKVLISNNKARGVQFDFAGSRYEVRAKREVIISAGAVKSPQILMLSGIGPRKTLEEFDIPVVADLPVGKNFLDNPSTIVNFVSSKDRPTLIEKLQDPDNIMEYIKNKTGILAISSGGIGVFFNSDNATSQHYDLPEYDLIIYEQVVGSTPQYLLNPEVYEGLYGPYVDTPAIACCVTPHSGITLSSGYVSIRSSNPYDPPVIDPRYYSVQQDVRHVVEGMKTCYRLMGSPFLKELGIEPFETVMLGCDDEKFDLDDYLECYARSFILSSHLAGGVRMGDVSDPNTVVDTHLRVKGIQGLRVVDASVMPSIPRAKVGIPVTMIAEKAADIIMGCH